MVDILKEKGSKHRDVKISTELLGLAVRGLPFASCGHFSGRSHCHSGLPQVPFSKKVLLTKWNDDVVLTKNVCST